MPYNVLIKSFIQRLPLITQLPMANKLALAASSLSLLCCVMVIIASHQQNSGIHHQHMNLLGQQLSEQLAINARPALMQGDSLNLQAMLVKLATSDTIIQAAIFNIDNKPIAEAGERIDGKAFMAPIHFQDTIAGHSLIVLDRSSLDTQITGLLLQQLLLSLLFSGCCYALALWLGGKFSTQLSKLTRLIAAPNYPANARREKLTYWGEDELQILIQQTLKGPNHAAAIDMNKQELALLQIKLLNTENEGLTQAQLEKYQQQLNTVCKLYEGRLELSRPNSFSALFYQNKKENDHPFKAICCGKIIEQLITQDKTLTFKAAIVLSHQSDEFRKQNAIEQAIDLMGNQPLSIDDNTLQHFSVNGRLEEVSERIDDPVVFGAPYNELIERQLAALQLQFTRNETALSP
ncbi:MAG: putative membrane protein affecting hemolysin expression [Pseudohongiellaceae bacterium]